MNEDGNLNLPDQDTMHNTQALPVPGRTDQGVDSENSSGSVYHSTPQLVTGEEEVEERPARTSAATSESDSDQHFSDAIQESDDSSVYSAQDNFSAAEEDKKNLKAHSSHDQWSPSGSNISVLPKPDNATNFTSKIPLPTHVGNSSSTGSLHFQQAIESAEGSLIPVPIRFRDLSPGLRVTVSEPKMDSRSASPDKDVPSSESENITAISVKVSNNDGTLEKYKSDDLLGEPVTFPLDTPEVKRDDTQTTTGPADGQNNEDVISRTTQDSEVSTFTLTDCRTHRYESENDRPSSKNPTVVISPLLIRALVEVAQT